MLVFYFEFEVVIDFSLEVVFFMDLFNFMKGDVFRDFRKVCLLFI